MHEVKVQRRKFQSLKMKVKDRVDYNLYVHYDSFGIPNSRHSLYKWQNTISFIYFYIILTKFLSSRLPIVVMIDSG
jgi:hypothetical protein